MSSPYKKIKTANQKWVGYISLSKLDANKGYKIKGVVETKHEQYGPGFQVYVDGCDGKEWRAQLPGKYIQNLGTEGVLQIRKDVVVDKKTVYLVFREKMMDNSFRMDIIEGTSDLDRKFKTHEDFPELEDSITEDEVAKIDTEGDAGKNDTKDDTGKNESEDDGKKNDEETTREKPIPKCADQEQPKV